MSNPLAPYEEIVLTNGNFFGLSGSTPYSFALWRYTRDTKMFSCSFDFDTAITMVSRLGADKLGQLLGESFSQLLETIAKERHG